MTWVFETMPKGEVESFHFPSWQTTEILVPEIQRCLKRWNKKQLTETSPTWGPENFMKYTYVHMGVSKNNGTPKSSILIGFSIINHPFWGTIIFGTPHIFRYWIDEGYYQLITSMKRTLFSLFRAFFVFQRKGIWSWRRMSRQGQSCGRNENISCSWVVEWDEVDSLLEKTEHKML